MIRDVRDWIAKAEEIKEVIRINEQVDWDEEMGAITYMLHRAEGAPALLFENIKGYSDQYQVLFNSISTSTRRYALTMGLPLEAGIEDLIRMTRDKMKTKIPPVIVEKEGAPVNENVHLGEEINLLEFPTPKMWPLDGGRYIGSADIIITKDPDAGWLNVGTYRQMVMGPREVGFYISPGKDARLHREKYWKKGQPCEVAAVYGVDPLLYVVGSQSYPKNVSEFDFAGGIKGEAIELVKGEVTDLLFPARAEIVIEGLAYPDRAQSEGPFGEFTGYYGRPVGDTPYIDIKCIHHRNNPIMTSALMADYPSCDMGLFWAIARSAKVWDDLENIGIPGIKGVYCYPSAASAAGMMAVSIEQQYAGHAAQVLALAAQCMASAYYTKWIVAVDEDVDPTDINQVLWAMSTRCNPADNIDILRDTWSTWLDPSQNPPEVRPYGSKALINACKQHKFLSTFSKRSRIRREMYDQITQKWNKLGLPGQAPELTTFEE